MFFIFIIIIIIIIFFFNYYYVTINYFMQYNSKWLISPWGLGTNLLYFIFCLYYMFVLCHNNKQIQYKSTIVDMEQKLNISGYLRFQYSFINVSFKF